MNLNKIILFPILILSWISANTPLEYTLGFTSGYDSNVMRFSSAEFTDAAIEPDLMGGANTFDSFVYKLGLKAKKSIWEKGKKEIYINGLFSWSDYKHNQEREYWSGGMDAIFRWGSYKNIKYSVRHLNRFYLRHYVDRDISRKILSPCAFTDRNQSMNLTQKIHQNHWINLGAGYLQRYYDKPFPEFDLEVLYIKGKLNQKLKKIGTIAFQLERGRAVSKSHYLPERPSSFNRSYETMEWYVPVKINHGIPFINELGISVRSENRAYDAEDPDDPLHAGRSHLDTKYDVWVKKEFSDDLSATISGRYRTRKTQSAYGWVTDLKSFNQVQIWCKIEWDLIYDRY